jgi:hypothetical protein
MSRLRGFVLLAGLVLMTGGLYGDDKTEPPVKGRLPTYWTKLGLSDEQKQKTFKVMSEHHEKVVALEKQLKELKDKEKSDLEEILTEEQKKHLREMIASKAPAEKTPDKKPETKPEEKKTGTN